MGPGMNFPSRTKNIRLRGSDLLIQKRDKPIVIAEDIRKIARDRYGIGEEKEEDIELALGFFHDTGTIVYPSEL